MEQMQLIKYYVVIQFGIVSVFMFLQKENIIGSLLLFLSLGAFHPYLNKNLWVERKNF